MDNLIKALNHYVRMEYGADGIFIISQTHTIDRNFKSFRHYKLGLYYVIDGKNIPIIEDAITEKYTEENKDIIELDVKVKFMEMVLDFVASDEFKDLMYGRVDI